MDLDTTEIQNSYLASKPFVLFYYLIQCDVKFLRPAQPGQFPWLVSVTRDGRHVCGGVILTSRHVLTAATCVQAPGVIGVTIREHHLTQADPGQTGRDVTQIQTHPEFRLSDPPEHNLAVLTLDQRLVWSVSEPELAPVCWGPLSPLTSQDTQDTDHVYTSWGLTQFGPAAVPHWTRLPVVDRDTCQVTI